MSDFVLSLKLTGDASGLRAEVANAEQAVQQLSQTSQAAGGTASQGLNAVSGSAGRTSAALKETAVQANAAAQATGLTANQMRQLAPQLNDIATGLLTGQSPFMILAQQGGQVTQIFGGVRQTLAAFPALLGQINPVVGAISLLTLGLGAAAYGAETAGRTLHDTENRLRSTREEWKGLGETVNAAAREFAAVNDFGTTESITAARTIAGSRNFSGGQKELEAMLETAGDLSKVLGNTLPEAATMLRKALDEPGSVAEELAQTGFRGFEAETARLIRNLQAAEGPARATAEVLRLIGEAASGARDNMTVLAQLQVTLAGFTTGPGVASLFGLGDADGGASRPSAQVNRRAQLDQSLASSYVQRSRELRQQQVRGDLSGLRDAANDSRATPSDRASLAAGEREAQAALFGLRGPAAQFFQGLGDQVTVSRAEPGAGQTIASTRLALQRTMQRDGSGASPAMLDRAQGLAETALMNQAGNDIVALQRQADGVEKVAAAMRAGGAAAAALAEEQVRAAEAARKYSGDAEKQDTVARMLAGQFENLRQAQMALHDAQAANQQEQQLEMLSRERDLVTANVEERNRELSVLRERQRIIAEGGDPNSAGGQARLVNAARIADATTELKRQEAAMGELRQVGTTAADTLGSAFADMASKGKFSFKTLASAGEQVAAQLYQAFFRLAVINPILKSLGLSSGPTLSDVGSLFGSSGPSAAQVGGVNTAIAETSGFLFHTGGVVGAEAPAMRGVSPDLFTTAPRHHSGLMPGEFPAVLRSGEGVFTPEQMSRLGPVGGITMAPTIHFHGDAGNPEDRRQMLEELRRQMRQEVTGMLPGIIAASNAATVNQANRGGSFAAALGRR